MIPLPDRERILLGPGPSMVPPRVMRAMAAPVLSHLDPDLMAMMDELRGTADGRVPIAGGLVLVRGVGHRHVGHGDGGGQPRGRRHARALDCRRLLRRSDRRHERAVRRGRDAPVVRVGQSRRSGGRPPRAEGATRGHRHRGARGNVNRRAEPGRAGRRGRARTRRADHRRRGDLARRASRSRWRSGASARRTAARRSAWARRRASRRSRSRPAPWSGASRRAASPSTSGCSRTTGCAASTTTRSARRCSTLCARRC